MYYTLKFAHQKEQTRKNHLALILKTLSMLPKRKVDISLRSAILVK
jgi:hypothetical protein